MQALLDTNVVLDLLLRRQPHDTDALAIWEANRAGGFIGYVSAITPITVFYVTRKSHSSDAGRELVRQILKSYRVCALEGDILEAACRLPMDDYEDAVHVASAQAYRLDAIVTRDVKDFAHSPLPALSPAAFLAQLG
jgi:predicted nucleic acid-binding protein